MCVQVLIDWINSELEEERIIVKDLEEDCYDGQVLQKLFGEQLSLTLRHHASHGIVICKESVGLQLAMYQYENWQ